MADFPLTYDPELHALRLDGPGGASVLVGIFLKAKFGESYDPETLFNPGLASIAREIFAHSLFPSAAAEGPFPKEMLFKIARRIVEQSWHTAWWEKSADERVAYLQEVVASPFTFTDEQIGYILEAIERELYLRRRVAHAADAAGEPSERANRIE